MQRSANRSILMASLRRSRPLMVSVRHLRMGFSECSAAAALATHLALRSGLPRSKTPAMIQPGY